MKAFLRKKSTSDAPPTVDSPPRLPPLSSLGGSTPSSPPTPLYARFASTSPYAVSSSSPDSANVNGATGGGAMNGTTNGTTGTRPVVSGPMTLGSANRIKTRQRPSQESVSVSLSQGQKVYSSSAGSRTDLTHANANGTGGSAQSAPVSLGRSSKEGRKLRRASETQTRAEGNGELLTNGPYGSQTSFVASPPPPHDKPLVPAPVPVSISINEADEAGEEAGERPVLSLVGSARVVSEYGHGHGAPLPRHTDLHQHTDPQHKEHKEHKDQQKEPRPEARDPSSALPSPPLSPVLQSPSKPKEKTKTTSSSGIKRYSRQGQVVGVSISNGGGEGVGDGQVASPNGITTTTTTTSRMGPEATGRPQGAAAPYMRSEDATSTLGDGDEYEYVPGAPAGGYASAGSANGHVFTANGYSSAGSETHRSVDGRSEKERERGRGSDAKRRTASASASSNGSYETMEKVAGVGTGSAIVRVKALPALEESAVVSSVSPSPASPSTSTSTPPPPPTQIPKPTHHTHRTHGRTASDGSANVIVDTYTQSHTHSHGHSRSTSASQIPVPTPSQIPTPTSPVQVPGPRLRRMSGSTSISVSSDKDRDKQGQGPITPPHSIDDHTSILSSHSSSHARHRTASLSRSKRDTSHTQRQDEEAPRTSVGMRKGPLIFQSKEERFGSASAAMGTANGPWPPPVPVQAPIPPTTASQPVDIPVFIRPSEDKGFIPPRRRSMQILAPSTSPSPSISTSLPVLSSSSPSSSPVSLIQGAQVPLMTREEREMEKERSKSRERGHRRHGTGTGTVITTGAPIPPSTQTSPVTPRQTYGDLSNADEPALPRADVQSVKSVKSISTTSDHQHHHQHHHHQGRFLANNDIHHPLPVSPQLAHLREAKTSQTSLSMNESDESSAYPRTSMSQHSQSHSGSKPNSRAGREREREGEVEVESEVDGHGHGGAPGIEVANGTRSVPGSGAEAEAEDGVLSAEASVKDRKKKKKAEEKEEKERQKDRSVTPHSRHLAVPPLLAPSTSEKAHNRLRKAHKHSSMPPLAPSPASSTNHRESMMITHSSPTHSPNPNTNTNTTFSDSGTVSTQAGSQTSRKTSSRRLLTKQRPAGNGKHGHGHGDPQQQHERPTHSREEGSLVIVDSDIPNGNGNDNNTQQSQSRQTHKAGILSIDEDPFAKSGLQVLPVPSKAPSQKSSTLATDAISSSSSDAMGNKGREISPSGMVMEMEHGRTPRRAREGQNQHQHQNRRQWRLGVSDEGGLGDEDDGGGGHGYVGERDGSEDHSHYSASIGSGGGGGISINGATSISNGHGYSSSAPSVVEKRSYRNGHGHGHGLGRSGSVSGSVSGSEDQHRGRMMMRPSGVEEVLSSEVETVPEDDEDWSWYPLVKHLSEPALLAALLNELSFPEWMALWSLTKEVRTMFEEVRELREVALERYLGIVGYVRWRWEPHTPEPLRLTLKELAMYMRGVSTPPFEYAQTAAAAFLPEKTPEQIDEERGLKKGARAYTRLVIRLREQAETEADQVAMMKRAPSSLNGHSPVGTPGVGVVGSRRASAGGPPPAWGSVPPRRAFSRQSTRAPSPSFSIYAHGHNNAPREDPAPFLIGATFRSPLFRLRRAPLLRVFVPSAEGEWLSDEAILECETELKKAGVVALLRPGDIVWDTALGDEGNVGRLAWDGRYLIDLDFTYSETGDLPAYLPSLAFPPPYFHRVIRTAGEHNNPVCHIDVSPWGNEIMSHLQLLQDRVKTETPQGSVHMVVHWVHRSSFRIRTPPPYQTQSQRSLPGAPLLVLPTKERRPVDMGWVGTVVVETEGTNEGLADLKGRCRGGYPSRKGSKRVNGDAENGTSADVPNVGERERCVWRILRERSRPGEIWLKAVTFKERLLP